MNHKLFIVPVRNDSGKLLYVRFYCGDRTGSEPALGRPLGMMIGIVHRIVPGTYLRVGRN